MLSTEGADAQIIVNTSISALQTSNAAQHRTISPHDVISNNDITSHILTCCIWCSQYANAAHRCFYMFGWALRAIVLYAVKGHCLVWLNNEYYGHWVTPWNGHAWYRRHWCCTKPYFMLLIFVETYLDAWYCPVSGIDLLLSTLLQLCIFILDTFGVRYIRGLTLVLMHVYHQRFLLSGMYPLCKTGRYFF